MTLDIQRIVGYRDIFGKPKLFYKKVLARRIGRRRLLQLSALMLTYCRKGVEPSLEELIQKFFIYKEDFDEKGYEQVIMSFQQLAAREPGAGLEFFRKKLY